MDLHEILMEATTIFGMAHIEEDESPIILPDYLYDALESYFEKQRTFSLKNTRIEDKLPKRIAYNFYSKTLHIVPHRDTI